MVEPVASGTHSPRCVPGTRKLSLEVQEVRAQTVEHDYRSPTSLFYESAEMAKVAAR